LGLKITEVTEMWRRPHNEELNDLYSSPNNMVIKSRRWARHVARTEERRGLYRLLVGKREEKLPLE